MNYRTLNNQNVHHAFPWLSHSYHPHGTFRWTSTCLCTLVLCFLSGMSTPLHSSSLHSVPLPPWYLVILLADARNRCQEGNFFLLHLFSLFVIFCFIKALGVHVSWKDYLSHCLSLLSQGLFWLLQLTKDCTHTFKKEDRIKKWKFLRISTDEETVFRVSIGKCS